MLLGLKLGEQEVGEEGRGVSMSNNIIRWDGQGISVGDYGNCSHEVSGIDRF